MRATDVIVIGGGQAGLATSRCLAARGIEHVVLERGRVAERWRTERWASLRMLTPRWQSRLPGYRYEGPEPDGFMTMPEVIAHLEGYAASFAPPLELDTRVLSVRRGASGRYEVHTERGAWRARAVVIATGHCDTPRIPALASRLSPRVQQLAPSRYRAPEQVAPGGVLVVGASASGVQIADELRRAGREVTLAVGRHARMPRRYRGRDVMWWMDESGALDDRADPTRNLESARAQPSFQLVGRPDHRDLDLATLAASGVRLVGRAEDAEGEQVRFAGDLRETTAAAEQKLEKLLDRFDAHAATERVDAPPREPRRTIALDAPEATLDLRGERIGTVLWATGFRQSYPWLHVPGATDAHGALRHRGGVCDVPGLYTMGLFFMRRRKSSFLDGCGDDARELAALIASQLACSAAA